MTPKRLSHIFILIIGCWMALSSCSSTKFVPDNALLLDEVKVRINDTTGTFTDTDMLSFVRHRPNNKFFSIAKLRLGVYNISGHDSTRWWNKWVRRLGEPPVIFDSISARTDEEQLQRALNNAGFLKASVSLDSFPDHHSRKIKLEYKIDPGSPHIIRSISYEFPNDTLRELILADSARFAIHPGDRLDKNILEVQREYITSRLNNHGYWAFSKEFITFNADTTEGSRMVDLTMTVRPARKKNVTSLSFDTHRKYIVRRVICIPDYNAADVSDPRNYIPVDSVEYNGITILYGHNPYLRKNIIRENCFISAGSPYRTRDIDNTYQAFGRLSILKFINIRMIPAGSTGDIGLLDAYILLTPGRSQSFALEVEGTNSEGDLGVALALSYTHRNIGRASETLNIRGRGAYQALNGDLEGFIHDRYMEYGIESSLSFPKFQFPFISSKFKRRIRATTEVNLSINYQERPEYTRIISAIGWNYKWVRRRNQNRYVLTPLDISYVYLPASTNNFLDHIAPDNPLLRYSYEDHFIMRAGFQYYYSSKRREGPWMRDIQRNISTIRVNTEIAGNLLFAISSIINPRQDFHTDPYKCFGIRYSQYFRADGDYTYLHTFDRRQSLACHAGFGIGIPYGNSSILPFEKRFYGGGANGVRGWAVRTLGPGRYPATNTQSDFIHQCGDIRLNMSVEYRAKLFWVVEAGVFIDAGNIWTIRNYQSQPHGEFHFNSFLKEIALAYGAGLRLDFNYFLIRFDLGMKAHNPAIGQEPWPIIHPDWPRDHAFHFSIGYPF